MTTSPRSRSRQPAGTPTGGQFATSRQPRAGVVLEEGFIGLDNEVRDGQLISDREAAVLFDQARNSASFWAGRYGTDDADEAASRAMLAYLEARQRSLAAQDGQATVDATDRPAKDSRPDNVRAYVHQTVMTQTVLALADRTGAARRSSDGRARRTFDQRANEMAVALGRGLTGPERDALAADIRASFPNTNRPSSNFHQDGGKRLVSYDAGFSDDWLDQITDPTDKDDANVDYTDAVPGSFRAQAEQVMSTGGRAAQLQAKSLAWQIMAEKLDAPQPVHASISEYTAARTRKAVRSGGGAVAVARRVRAGKASADEAAALFAPFGDIDAAERAKALDVITNHPGYGDDLWDASVLAATRLIERKK